MRAISLFSSAGIGELLLQRNKIDFVLANELLEKRANCYHFWYPKTKMIVGDITNPEIKNEIIATANKTKAKLLLAAPPCQGLSTLGKNKVQDDYINDRRNFLILEVLDIIDACNFDYIPIENVPKFIEMYFPFDGGYYKLEQILKKKYSDKYEIEIRVLNAKDYGIAQSRPRAITKLYKKNLKWGWPKEQREITLQQAIGHLPSLEAGEDSGIKWHKAKTEIPRLVLAMQYTEPGKSAINNPIYYPKKEDGTRIKGFHNTFKRMVWNQPCPARTTYSGSLSSHNNVHPGHLSPDGTYSDSRVLTLLETFIVSSIPEDIEFPNDATDNFIRTIIGEAIPPKLLKVIINKIGQN